MVRSSFDVRANSLRCVDARSTFSSILSPTPLFALDEGFFDTPSSLDCLCVCDSCGCARLTLSPLLFSLTKRRANK